MGHATHFLGRLERLSSPQADFALELYRNSALVRFILEKSRLPDGAERVALSVDEQPGGPHIVVTRDGAFVTCLGAGMSTKDLPVIPRGKIEHLGSRYEAMHEAMARIRDDRETARLYRNLIRKGGRLSREDFSALAALMPISEGVCMSALTSTVSTLLKFQDRYSRGRYRRLTRSLAELLQHYSEAWWAVGHLLVLCGTRGPELGMKYRNPQGMNGTYALSWASIYGLYLPVILRANWTAARVGRDTVTHAKQQVREAEGFLELLCHALPLTAVGLRHRSVRAEVHKLIGRARRGLEQQLTPEEFGIADPVMEGLEQGFDPEGAASCLQAHRLIGASYALRIAERLPEGHPLRYASAEEVPDDVALAVPMYLTGDPFGSFQSFLAVVTATLPWLASADAASLYLPAQVIEVYDQHWTQATPEQTLAQLDARHRYFMRDQPARAEPTPGRNQPCPCGSGKKYKRCCGA